MKVRWTTGSVRVRITPGELERLNAGQTVDVELRVFDRAWRTIVSPGADVSGIELYGDCLSIRLASSDLIRLSDPGCEGVYFTTKSFPELRYFVEKDFPCIHPRPEETAETEETFAAPADFAFRHKREIPSA